MMMMTSHDALYPGDEIQDLIATYLLNDEPYYPNDMVMESKTYPSDQTQKGAVSHQVNANLCLNSWQSGDLPSDILDFISNTPSDAAIFADFQESQLAAAAARQKPHVYSGPDPCGGYDVGAAHAYGRSPAFSECSASDDNESSVDGSPVREYIPLPVQSYMDRKLELEALCKEPVRVNVTAETDEDSTPCSPQPETPTTAKQRRKRPSRRRQRQLWEFILETLTNPVHNPECITWVDREQGIFKFVKSQQVARLWGQRRQRDMSYEYFSRAMRHYYSRNIMKRVPGKRLVYQFLSGAEGWEEYAQRSPH